ncbi:MAG: tyrosine-type recombinase/integrase [candidate division WOR-3 bacterium]|jgi:integrase/recombinase XerD
MYKNNPVVMSRALVSRIQIVPYLTPEEVKRMFEVAKKGRNGERNSLLVKTLFETGLRVSECLSLTPRKIDTYEGHAVLYIRGKGNKDRMVACPDTLAYMLKAYAYSKNLKLDDRIWSISRVRVWQILKEIAEKAGLQKRVYPHLLRHSDALERLRRTGNPKALQIHLGHASFFVTARYLSTLTAEDALRIQQGVNFED